MGGVGREAAPGGAGGARDAARPPMARLAQPPPHGEAECQEPQRLPARLPGAQSAALAASSASSSVRARSLGGRGTAGQSREATSAVPRGPPRASRISIEIPAGLTELPQGFTVDVARHQPADLLEFALPHFTLLQQQKEGKGAADFGHEGGTWGSAGTATGDCMPSKGVNFAEEPMHTDSEWRGGEGGCGHQGIQGPGNKPFHRGALLAPWFKASCLWPRS